ncbi:zinc-binding dehydrogenase [Streptomyces sp. RKAG293]|uniref:zinc-binding dehydrogenase n=1 Tax=Streptomyces sp. RKAG293 TaxID=2893403 RepID=UPI0020349D8A|nr:zinc-binding dehydrogenase [Streptomyces sp. RKAG293]MCM2424125.1 zinc-binding dehydrogenase [Streptomyces sp. RKAG293]
MHCSFFFMRASGEQLAHLADLYNTGALHPVTDTVFAFAETPQAMAPNWSSAAHLPSKQVGQILTRQDRRNFCRRGVSAGRLLLRLLL